MFPVWNESPLYKAGMTLNQCCLLDVSKCSSGIGHIYITICTCHKATNGANWRNKNKERVVGTVRMKGTFFKRCTWIRCFRGLTWILNFTPVKGILWNSGKDHVVYESLPISRGLPFALPKTSIASENRGLGRLSFSCDKFSNLASLALAHVCKECI